MYSYDWQEVEKKLKSFYERVALNCDGYKVTLYLVRMGPFKNVIEIYVNGVIKGSWWTEDCEERRRFFCPKKKYLHTTSERKRLKKMPKWMLKELQAKDKYFNPDAIYVYYVPYWTSFQALKRHLIKHNKDIELLREEASFSEDRQSTKSPDSCGQESVRA